MYEVEKEKSELQYFGKKAYILNPELAFKVDYNIAKLEQLLQKAKATETSETIH
jgi:hypothetical protein